jgi:hypothetical protein
MGFRAGGSGQTSEHRSGKLIILLSASAKCRQGSPVYGLAGSAREPFKGLILHRTDEARTDTDPELAREPRFSLGRRSEEHPQGHLRPVRRARPGGGIDPDRIRRRRIRSGSLSRQLHLPFIAEWSPRSTRNYSRGMLAPGIDVVIKLIERPRSAGH